MKRVRLDSICEINPRRTNGVNSDALCSFIPMEYVDEYLGAVTKTSVRPVFEVEKGYTSFRDDDVLFAKITPCMENGKCAIAKNLVNGIGFGSTEFHIIRTRDEIIPEWAYYYLRQEKVRKEAERHMTGSAGQRRVPGKFLEETIIPLPPLDEQKRIAAILSKADRLRRLRRYARELSDSYLQSVFLEMFGDPVSNSKRWKIVQLKSLCSELYRYPTFYGFEYTKTGSPVVRIGNILPNGLVNPDLSDYVFIDPKLNQKFPRTMLELYDTVMAVRGDGSTVKRVGLVNSEKLVGANISPNLLRFKANPENSNPMYLFHLITSVGGQKLLEKHITKTAKKTITAEDIKLIQVPLPPLPLQQKFAQIVQKYERLRAQQRESARQGEHLFQSLLHRAFRGELNQT